MSYDNVLNVTICDRKTNYIVPLHYLMKVGSRL